ncbi:MAG: TonB-dependent receptor [Alphaproteobacteria bacterium]|nr:TonB-dependent receptor [Alphaproteobacteria bacterium]MDB5739722.1 TonB-dependent receptor [Alphaproteobacteria bacterium]
MSSNFKTALLCATSVIGLSTGAFAQASSGNVEAVTVTGSRLIQDITLSPTPITAVTSEQLQATTPTDIPDALNKLPVFIGGRTPRSQDNGSKNNGGNVLSLRNFGVSRTLILLDGHRVPASNQDGTVNVDTLPQMLMSRVDVVTGGASAVYGSDAVAGVVNFVLDKKFEGFKYNLNAGISKYGDAAEQQLGFAWGTSLLGGKGHFEMAARYFNQDMVPDDHRPYGQNNNTWVLAGSGSAAAPFTNVPYGHTFQQSQNGRIVCGTGCALNNYTFKDSGIASPMAHGVPTTTSNLEQGGDGGYNPFGTYRQKTQTKELFGRFSYDLTSDITGYVQASWAESGNYANWSPVTVSSSNNRASYFFANNPYLSTATAAQLQTTGTIFTAAPVVDSRNGSAPPDFAGRTTTPIFSAAGYQFNKIGGTDARSQGRIYNTIGTTRNIDVEAGLNGNLSGDFLHNWAWDTYFSHAENRTTVKNPHNTNNAKFLAAEDAVVAPAGTKVNGVDISGTVACWVTTQAAYASLYPGCQPINAFDPNGPSAASFDYMSQMTFWTLSQNLNNVGGTIHGGVGFGLPAGEITAAVSGEARWATYTMKSNASPTDFVNCTGLRLCQANAGSPTPSLAQSQTAAPSLWTQNVNAPVDVSNNVYEFATEVNVPLLKNVPMFQDLSLDVAGRYTNYSTSGEAETWKIGGDWHVNDTVRFRGTMSVDIRAPNLNDLFAPPNISSTGFTDALYTPNGNNSTQLVQQGNPNLVPEVAHTFTAGLVLTPDFIPGLSFSVDWYTTHMSGAITGISFQTTAVQNICYASAPAYNSPFCALAVRPIAPGQPGYATVANFPSQVKSSPLNAARQYMEGWDIEADYGWDMEDLISGFPGSVNLRHLVTYQPVNTTIQLPGAAPQWTAQPKTRMTTFLAYQVGDWGLNMQNQWLSGMKKATSDPSVAGNNQIYAAPRISSYDVLDVTVDRKFDLWGGNADFYFSVTNIGNTRAPLFPTNASNPGLFYPIGGGITNYYEDMGRYFTIGLKGNL